jgi:FkbH-like protein
MDKKFSWLGALKKARSEGKGVLNIRLALNSHSLQGFELELVGRWLSEKPDAVGFKNLRVAILSGYATQPLANAVRVAALKEGFVVQVYEAPFGAIRPEILAPDSDLYKFKPDLVLLDVGFNVLEHLTFQPMEGADVNRALEAELSDIQFLWDTLSARLGVPVIQHTLVAPAEVFAGVAERSAPWSPTTFIDVLNAHLIATGPAFVRWLDVDTLSKSVGLANWHDPRMMHHAKYGFATRYLPDYTNFLSATLREVLALTPKALILDLDNTLWGGVIGDDGLEEIRLGPDTAEGAAYQAFCHYLQGMGQRGVILGICSKNEMANVREVFEKHPHMPLRLQDIAVIRCNWQNKVANLLEIAVELNIDPSAMVFIDDNPAECELIRQQLPRVHVVQMDGDPASFVRRLDSLHMFHAQSFSREDLTRTKSYFSRAQSEVLRREASDLDSYLKSLAMKGRIERSTDAHLSRLAQMEMKTNQFNLSTRRLSQEQIQEMIHAANYIVLAVFLADRFADHGLVAYLAAKLIEKDLRITDWLMSCRVFSRTLENFTISHLVQEAQSRGAQRIIFDFVPTAKNAVMLKTFESIGFACEGEIPSGPWVYNVDGGCRPSSFISLMSEKV